MCVEHSEPLFNFLFDLHFTSPGVGVKRGTEYKILRKNIDLVQFYADHKYNMPLGLEINNFVTSFMDDLLPMTYRAWKPLPDCEWSDLFLRIINLKSWFVLYCKINLSSLIEQFSFLIWIFYFWLRAFFIIKLKNKVLTNHQV